MDTEGISIVAGEEANTAVLSYNPSSQILIEYDADADGEGVPLMASSFVVSGTGSATFQTEEGTAVASIDAADIGNSVVLAGG